GVAVFGDPRAPQTKLVIAHHVEQRVVAHHSAKQGWLLHHRRTYQQATIRTAANAEVPWTGVTGSNEVLGCSNEVIENVLLVFAHAGLVPCLTVFTSAPQIR